MPDLLTHARTTIDLRALISVGKSNHWTLEKGQIVTDTVHCLSVGDKVHLCLDDGSCAPEMVLGSCVMVVEVFNDRTLAVSPNIEAKSGYIVKAATLASPKNRHGFRGVLTLGDTSEPQLIGAGAVCQGSDQVLVKGSVCADKGAHLILGDAFSPSVEIISSKTGCDRSSNSQFTVFLVAQKAFFNVAMSDNQYARLTGREPIVSYGESNDCGMVRAVILPSQTSIFKPGDCTPYRFDLQYGWDYRKYNKAHGCNKTPQNAWSAVISSGTAYFN